MRLICCARELKGNPDMATNPSAYGYGEAGCVNATVTGIDRTQTGRLVIYSRGLGRGVRRRGKEPPQKM